MGKLQGQSSFFVAGPPAVPGEAHEPIVRFILKEIRGNTVLDIGGGQGAYALELQKAGYRPVVVDVDKNALAVATQNGLEVRAVTPDESIGENVADTVILIEVLEHVADPSLFLQSAIRAAKKRVIFTLPCTDDFVQLFQMGLSYAHIAVSDHLHHFSENELKSLLAQVSCKYRLEKGDFLFPHASMFPLNNAMRWPLFGKLCMFPLRVLNRLGGIQKSIPSRFYGVIDVAE
jgi:ubiquinone/menaquinone biosynthesis C-methylase UbiE